MEIGKLDEPDFVLEIWAVPAAAQGYHLWHSLRDLQDMDYFNNLRESDTVT